MTIRPSPKVSVAIPVYNGEPYLAEAISSVLAQNFGDFELIICDNASSDRTMEIARSFVDTRIRILQNERNIGFGPNWNRCLREANGRFVKILPHDDLLDPDCLAKEVRVLEDDTAAALSLVFCARRIISASGRQLMTRGLRGKKTIYSGLAMARKTARTGTNPIGEPGAVLFRSSAAKAAGEFNITRPFVIDIDYWLRLLRHGDAVRLPETLASFRVAPTSHSVKILRRQAMEFSEFLEDISTSQRYDLSAMDIGIGKAAALANALGRAMFYRIAMKDAQ